MDDDLDRLDHALDVLQSPTTALAPPAASPPSADRLAGLLDLRHRLGVHDGLPTPLRDAATAFGDRCAGEHRRDDLAGLALRLLVAIDEQIIIALQAGFVDDRVVRTDDFADVRFLAFADADRDVTGQQIPLLLVAGVVASLPAGHRLREVLPSEQLYDMAGTGRELALLLGRPVPTLNGTTGPARRWYSVSDAVRLTTIWRSHQQRQIEARREQERREARDRRERFEASDVGRLYRAQQQLELMRKRGELPDDPPPAQPTIRGPGQVPQQKVIANGQ